MTKHNNVDISDDVERVKAALSQTAHHVRGKAEAFVNHSIKDAKSKTHSIEKQAMGYIKDNPFKTVAFSVLLGMIISRILK